MWSPAAIVVSEHPPKGRVHCTPLSLRQFKWDERLPRKDPVRSALSRRQRDMLEASKSDDPELCAPSPMWRRSVHSPSQQSASQESQKISPFWRRPAQSQNSNACQRDDLTLKNEQLELEIQLLRENVDKLMVDVTSKATTIKAQQSQKTPHTSSKGDEKATSPARATPSKDLINIYDDVTRDIERELMNIIHTKSQECDYLAQRLAEREISAENAFMQLNTSRRVQQHLQTTCSSFLSELAHEFAHVSHELRGQQRQHASLEEHRKMAEQGLKQLTGVLEEKQTALDSLQTRLSTSEDALTVLSESSKLAKGENTRLKDELDAFRQRDTQRELDRESFEHRNAELELEIAQLRDNVKEQDKRMLDIANKADALTEQCISEKAAAAAALKTANASHSETKKQMAALRDLKLSFAERAKDAEAAKTTAEQKLAKAVKELKEARSLVGGTKAERQQKEYLAERLAQAEHAAELRVREYDGKILSLETMLEQERCLKEEALLLESKLLDEEAGRLAEKAEWAQLRSMLEDELSVLTEACVKLQRREQSLADDNQRLAREAQALRLQLSVADREALAVRVQLAEADEKKTKEARDAKAQAQVRQLRLQLAEIASIAAVLLRQAQEEARDAKALVQADEEACDAKAQAMQAAEAQQGVQRQQVLWVRVTELQDENAALQRSLRAAQERAATLELRDKTLKAQLEKVEGEISECTRDLSFAQQDIRELEEEETLVLDDEHALELDNTLLKSRVDALLLQNARAKSICVAEDGGGAAVAVVAGRGGRGAEAGGGAAEVSIRAAAGIDDSAGAGAVAGALGVAVSRGAGHVAYTFPGGVSSRACVPLPGKGEEGGQLQQLQLSQVEAAEAQVGRLEMKCAMLSSQNRALAESVSTTEECLLEVAALRDDLAIELAAAQLKLRNRDMRGTSALNSSAPHHRVSTLDSFLNESSFAGRSVDSGVLLEEEEREKKEEEKEAGKQKAQEEVRKMKAEEEEEEAAARKRERARERERASELEREREQIAEEEEARKQKGREDAVKKSEEEVRKRRANTNPFA